MRSALHLHMMFHKNLVLCQMLFLSGHQILFFLFPAFQSVLLFGCQRSAEAWERLSKWWLSVPSLCPSRGWIGPTAGTACGGPVGNANLWDEEWFTRIQCLCPQLS